LWYHIHRNMTIDFLIIGGGAAGFFGALAAKRANPLATVVLLEKTAVFLSKVRVSGGGRCNVTHACFEPAPFSKHYPRGEKELLGPFHRFQAKDTVEWFESRGVSLKIEADGRMFPTTDSSETIIECLVSEAQKLGVDIRLRARVNSIRKEQDHFVVNDLTAKKLLLATGSSSEGYAFAQSLGHTIVDPVPSLFTFNVPDSPLSELSGVAVEKVEIRVGEYAQVGPLLITHFGFSGPAALKLSAKAARYLHSKEYSTQVQIDWVPGQELKSRLYDLKRTAPQKNLLTENPFNLPKSLWKHLLGHSKRLNDISFKELDQLAAKLHSHPYTVKGKTTNKEEFVTCGGVSLREINFKTMESKLVPGLYFAGEILDIDGVTGGFNFQNAWTTGYIAGNSM
jgi:predicted Rossmann fold flavoprotein